MLIRFLKILFILLTSVTSIFFAQKYPDLKLYGFVYHTHFRSGQNNQFLAYILNQGDTLAPSSVFKVYLSADTLKRYIDTSTDIEIIEHRYPAIEPGVNNDFEQIKFSVPELPVGSRWMILYQVDAYNEIVEVKSNNSGQLHIVEILPPLYSPELITPSNGERVTLPVTFRWRKAINAEHYIFNYYQLSPRYNNKYNFKFVEVSDTVLTLNEMNQMSTYYWEVVSADNNGTNIFEPPLEVRSIYINGPTVELIKPELNFPSDGQTGVSTTPTLSWFTPPGVMYFQLQVSTDQNYSDLILNINSSPLTHTVTVENTQKIENLAYDTEYFWRVKFFNDGGESPWSDQRRFRTKPLFQPLDSPQPSTPANNAVEIGRNHVVLIWNVVNEVLFYQVQISTDVDFESIIHQQDSLQVNSVIIDSLQYNTTFYWRVRAKNNYTISEWSPVYNFKTVPEPPPNYLYAPTLVAPANGLVEIRNNPVRFAWTKIDSATGYLLEMAKDTLMKDSFSSTRVGWHWVNMNVGFSVKYFWRVIPYDFIKLGTPSKVWSFSTMPITGVLSWPYLRSPNNMEENVSTNPTIFKWTIDSNAVGYELNIGLDRDFLSTVASIRIEGDTTYKFYTLEPGKRYFWRIRSFNQYYEGIWTSVSQFVTSSLTDIKEESQLQLSTGIFQNYPNPFNPVTRIQFNIKNTSFVELNVYDMLGRKVESLTKKEYDPGTYTVDFNGSNISSGIYFYQLKTSDTIITRKMILIK